ncbi:nucleolar protein [Pestalotiopsis sp. IQ-011]
MAPELRARRASAGSQKSTPAKSTPKSKGAATTKRKAADDASPVVIKKTKAVKADAPAKKATKASKPAKKAEKVEEPAEPVTADDEHTFSDDEQDEDQALALAGVSDSEDDAAADEGAAYKEGQDVGKAPVSAKAAEKSKKAGKAGKEEKAVAYIGRIPHGFYERQMHEYFGQFGEISRLRLSRNKKTGQSKHFAFIEFADESTAEYVVKSMNNYLLFGHILKCRIVPNAQVHDDLFKGAGKRYKAIPGNKLEGNKLKKPLSEGEWATKINNENKKRAHKAKKLSALGYDFDAPELKEAVAPAAAAIEAPAEEAPKAEKPEAEKPEAGADEEMGEDTESPDGEEVKKSAKASKQNGAKAGKKAKKPAKATKKKA